MENQLQILITIMPKRHTFDVESFLLMLHGYRLMLLCFLQSSNFLLCCHTLKMQSNLLNTLHITQSTQTQVIKESAPFRKTHSRQATVTCSLFFRGYLHREWCQRKLTVMHCTYTYSRRQGATGHMSIVL